MNAAEHKRLSELTTELMGARESTPLFDKALKDINDFVTDSHPNKVHGTFEDGKPWSADGRPATKAGETEPGHDAMPRHNYDVLQPDDPARTAAGQPVGYKAHEPEQNRPDDYKALGPTHKEPALATSASAPAKPAGAEPHPEQLTTAP